MLRSMYSGISGMRANQTKLDVIGNNIANVGTTAFKSSTARFSDMLYQNTSSATAPTSQSGGTNAKQVGLGAQLSSINKVMGQGNAMTSGRALDVCVDGEGYIMVSKGPEIYGATITLANQAISGNGTNDIAYTRDGNLSVDYEGNLITADGHRVMGYLLEAKGDPSIAADGKANFVDADSPDLKAVGEGAQLNTLKIPDSVEKAGVKVPVKSFSIGRDGVITATLGDGSRTALGQIAMATFKNPEGLETVGSNLLQKSPNSGVEIIKTPIRAKSDTTSLDNSKGFGDLIQGALESSNVDLTEQFTDMITATRSFQASSKMITTGDEILQTITNLMR